jgi:hypothetical protein
MHGSSFFQAERLRNYGRKRAAVRADQIATWQSRMTDGQETAAGEGGPSRLRAECAIIRAAILP